MQIHVVFIIIYTFEAYFVNVCYLATTICIRNKNFCAFDYLQVVDEDKFNSLAGPSSETVLTSPGSWIEDERYDKSYLTCWLVHS